MKRFKNVLLVSDPNTDDRPAIARAATLIREYGAQLTILEVLEEPLPHGLRLSTLSISLNQIKKDIIEIEQNRLNELIASNNIDETVVVIFGRPFIEIIREVLRSGPDLVINSAEGSGALSDTLFGSTDMHLLRKCPCPVWITKSTERNPYRCILAAVDLSDPEDDVQDANDELNRKILDLAGSLTLQEACGLHVVYVWYSTIAKFMRGKHSKYKSEGIEDYIKEVRSYHRRKLDRFLRDVKKWMGAKIYDRISPKSHLPNGFPDKEIPALAE